MPDKGNENNIGRLNRLAGHAMQAGRVFCGIVFSVYEQRTASDLQGGKPV